jgi:small subunit ribosomal protein S6
MAFYENVFIARQDISSAAVEGLADKFAGVIAENGGSVSKKEFWGLRNLAYKIKKNRKGHYVLFNIDAPSAAVDEMQRQMKINEDILRYLTIKVEELDPNPSAVMQSRSSRDERPRRGERRFGGNGDEPVSDDSAAVPVVSEAVVTNGAAAPAASEGDKES